MVRSSGFGSTLCNYNFALFRLAFASAPWHNHLTLLHIVTRRPILQKVRDQTITSWWVVLSLLVSIQFQVLFHSPPGVLFTFPSRYYTLSVTWSYLALRDGPRIFRQDSSCPAVLWILPPLKQFRLRGFYPVLPCFPTLFNYRFWMDYGVRHPKSVTTFGLGSSDFARHYFRNRLFTFFSSGYLDVSVPRVPFIQLCIHCMITLYYQCCVPTFGYLRISVHLQLPVAFRSLSRPSSAPSAKASTICSL